MKTLKHSVLEKKNLNRETLLAFLMRRRRSPLSVPASCIVEMDVTKAFSIWRVYDSRAMTRGRLLTTLKIPKEFSSMLVTACKTFLLLSNQVTLGLGNQRSAFAVRMPSENVRVGAE